MRYLQDSIKDEKFILYGTFGALAFMIDPVSSLVFYSLTGLVLLVYNIAAKRAARGFYQLLAGLFGFSVIFYPIGYFTDVVAEQAHAARVDWVEAKDRLDQGRLAH